MSSLTSYCCGQAKRDIRLNLLICLNDREIQRLFSGEGKSDFFSSLGTDAKNLEEQRVGAWCDGKRC